MLGYSFIVSFASMLGSIINDTLNFKLHKLTFTTAQLHFTAAQIVINCTLKYALT